MCSVKTETHTHDIPRKICHRKSREGQRMLGESSWAAAKSSRATVAWVPNGAPLM